MIRSELAEELGVTPSVVRKWLLVYSGLTGQTPETRLDEQTVAEMRLARTLMREHPSMTFREALERTLGQYTEAIPPASVTQMMGQLDRLDSTLACLEAHQRELQTNQEAMASKLEAIADYLRKMLSRRSGTGDPTSAPSSTDEHNSGR